jgi:hypothetical protein
MAERPPVRQIEKQSAPEKRQGGWFRYRPAHPAIYPSYEFDYHLEA